MPRSGMSMRRAASPVTLGVCICRPTNMAAQDSSSDMLRDYIIVKFLADRPENSPPISSLKTDDGLLNKLKALFKEADLPEPMYMNSTANLYSRINHFVLDSKGNFKTKVDELRRDAIGATAVRLQRNDRRGRVLRDRHHQAQRAGCGSYRVCGSRRLHRAACLGA
jgi:hypothetical protein